MPGLVASLEELNKAIGRNISFERTQRGLTQAQLAVMVGLDEKTVSRHECGNHITLSHVYWYAEALGCNVADILNVYESREKRLIKEMMNVPQDDRPIILENFERDLKLYCYKPSAL